MGLFSRKQLPAAGVQLRGVLGAPGQLIRLTRGATLVAPSSVHWEIGNALSGMFKRKAIESDDAVKVLEGYAGIPLRLLDPPLRQAVQLCRDLNVYAYDAYVIACAINQRAPILSLDRREEPCERSAGVAPRWFGALATAGVLGRGLPTPRFARQATPPSLRST